MDRDALIPCIGCGALVPDTDGPTHRYIGASPGCWQRYGELLAREYGEYAYPDVHRLTVDAYAVQHPGVPGKQSSQSVAVHLMSLCLVLERGWPVTRATAAMQRLTHRGYPWLEPPASRGEVTVLAVLAAANLDDHMRRARQWAESSWLAWPGHHATIRTWLEGAEL